MSEQELDDMLKNLDRSNRAPLTDERKYWRYLEQLRALRDSHEKLGAREERADGDTEVALFYEAMFSDVVRRLNAVGREDG